MATREKVGCNSCGDLFSQHNIKRHESTCGRTFSCPTCKKTFSSKTTMIFHHFSTHVERGTTGNYTKDFH